MKYTFTTLFIAAFYIFTNSSAFAQCSINVSIIQSPDTICEGTSFTLSANTSISGVSFQWTGPNSYSNTGQNITLTNVNSSMSGTYKVIATKATCTSDSDTLSITVNARPMTPLGATNAPICIGDTLAVAFDSGSSQNWHTPAIWGPAGFSDTLFASKIPNASKANAGTYMALVTDTLGCVSDTGRFTIPANKINTKPATPVIVDNGPICKGDTLKLNGPTIQTGEKYNWTGPGTLTFNTKDVTLANYTLAGINRYILTIDSNGCHSIPDTVDIDVRPTAVPKVVISADPGFIVGTNVLVTLTANPVDTGINIQYQWKINGNDVVGATGKTFQVTTLVDIQQGDAITVSIVTGPTCNSTTAVTSNPVVININLGVEQLINKDNLSLYPNPVKDLLIVDNVSPATTITNISGQILQLPITTKNNKTFINTSTLPDGIYIIRMNERAIRFIKQK